MAGLRSFIRVDAHEELTRVCELLYERVIMGNEALYRVVMADIAKIAENRHKTLRLEWKTINVYGHVQGWGIDDTFLLNVISVVHRESFDLVREKGRDNGQKAGDYAIVPHYMSCNGGDSK